jgi:hypothetical protein
MNRTIHLVFKTHLDIGFTDHAEKVRAQYHERFIPQAIETGTHFFRENPERPAFIWTTGAWLIWDHLNSQPADRVRGLERAIERGIIRWHALPFTTHSELMSPALFRAGLSFGQELDRRFGKTTTAAKMTDVPGHTRGIVPLLAEAGVKFLHLGVNTASPVPDVPDVFRWRAPDGSELIVMYQASYGATHFPAGMAEGLSFAHTNDNAGPQSVPQAIDAYRELRRHYPDAKVEASTLDAYGDLLWARREQLPVVELEIGDSWIHGSATDPIKMQRFLALQRLYDRWARQGLTPERAAFGRGLTLVAEHTCGVDIKSYLRDETAWDRSEFEAARKSDYRFAFTEASWTEQRAYLDAALAALGPADRKIVEAEQARPVARTPAEPLVPATSSTIAVEGWSIGFDPATGDVTSIERPGGRTMLDSGSCIGFRYESYDHNDVARHLDMYLTHREEWAVLDHGKPGLEKAATARSQRFVPTLLGLTGQTLVMAMEDAAHRELGAPERVTIELSPVDDKRSELVLTLLGKPANRMPEASFLHFAAVGASTWEFCRMGLWQEASRVVRRGGGQLQAVSSVRARLAGGGMLQIDPLDTPLVAPGEAPFMPFNPEPPDFTGGLRFNLHNNKWGTNFPMWWDGDLRARFLLTARA